jgi:hypothetical protein
VRAQDDGVIAGEAPDQLARFDDLFGIESGSGLVENQHFRVVDQCLREPHALAISLRELRAVAVGHVVDARALHHRRYARLPIARRHPLDAGDEVQILPHGHLGIERRRFGQVAGPALRVDGMVEDVEAGHRGAAFRGRHVAGQDPHGRRLPGPIWPQESEDFPPFDAKTDVVHGGDAAVAFSDVLNLNHTIAPFPGSNVRPYLKRRARYRLRKV